MSSVKRRPVSRLGLRLGLAALALFSYFLCLAGERIELKERNGRIETLEQTLQESRSDEAFLRVTIERECNYAEVHRLARDKWGMDVADRNQRIMVASDESQPALPVAAVEPATQAGFLATAERVTRIFRENVAQARPSKLEGGDGSPTR
jgi:hypothetical protein